MITILNINKQGNKIVSYTCTDGKETKNLSKDEIINQINNKNVSNARIQNYKGQIIIRVDDATKSVTKIDSRQNTNSNNKKAPYTILTYIDEAKNAGIHTLSLSDIEVNTANLAIRKVKKTEVTLDSPVKSNDVYDKLSDLYSKYFELSTINGKLALIKCKMNQSVINVPFGVSIIADNCFEGLYKVRTIAIPLLCVDFQPRAFHGLINLENIIISDTSSGDDKIKEIIPAKVRLDHYINHGIVIDEPSMLSLNTDKFISSNSEFVVKGFNIAEAIANKLNLNTSKITMYIGDEDTYGWCEAVKINNKIVEYRSKKEFNEILKGQLAEKDGCIEFWIEVPKSSVLYNGENSHISVEYSIYYNKYKIVCTNVKDIFKNNKAFTYEEILNYINTLKLDNNIENNLITIQNLLIEKLDLMRFNGKCIDTFTDGDGRCTVKVDEPYHEEDEGMWVCCPVTGSHLGDDNILMYYHDATDTYSIDVPYKEVLDIHKDEIGTLGMINLAWGKHFKYQEMVNYIQSLHIG